jgi:ABC-type enterochelin transport system substrate-binding protein
MKRNAYQTQARPPDIEEVAVLDAIAFEILQNLVIEGQLVPLTKKSEEYYIEHYKQRKQPTDHPHLRSS